jgi:hypothetical protein
VRVNDWERREEIGSYFPLPNDMTSWEEICTHGKVDPVRRAPLGKRIMKLMTTRQHWENVYGTKAPDQVSWFRPHLEMSLAFVRRATPGKETRIIDVGRGGIHSG